MVKAKNQKVNFKRRKIDAAKRKSGGYRVIIKFLISVIILGSIGFGLVKLKSMFIDSDYFLVKGMDVKLYNKEGAMRTLSLAQIGDKQILGSNVFFVDLNELKQKVALAHPEFKNIVIRRLLPNKLLLQADLREPIAQIRSDRYYLVDKEGVLLPDVKNFPDSDLPIINGIGINLAKAHPFRSSSFEKGRLDKALTLINEIDSIKGLSGYRLNVLDISDPGNFSFYFKDRNVEIKIGNSHFHSRLQVLAVLLAQLGSDTGKFKYIDLRFENPIVGPR